MCLQVQGTAVISATGGTGHSCSLWSQRWACGLPPLPEQVPEVGQTATVVSDPRGWHNKPLKHPPSCEQAQVTAHTFLGAYAARHCQRTHNPGPISVGNHTTYLRLLQLPAGLCHRSYNPHIPILSAVSHSLPGLTEQGSPSQLLSSPALVWVGNRCQRAKSRGAKTQTENQGLCDQRRREFAYIAAEATD